MTGNLTGKYITGTWLQATDTGHLATTPTKILVFDDKGWIYYRTPAEILKDIGASSGYTLTEADKTEIAGKVVADGLEFTLADLPADGASGTDLSLGVTSAAVGQIAKISAVDANGVPTAWEPVDMPSGGGEKTLSLIASYDFTDNTASVFEETGLDDLTELIFLPTNVTNDSTNSSGLTLKINNIDVAISLVPIGKKGTNTGENGEPWEVCRYNGVFWECLLCNDKSGASFAAYAASHAILNNQAIRNVGPATKIKLYVPNQLYKPVTGTLEVWGR